MATGPGNVKARGGRRNLDSAHRSRMATAGTHLAWHVLAGTEQPAEPEGQWRSAVEAAIEELLETVGDEEFPPEYLPMELVDHPVPLTEHEYGGDGEHGRWGRCPERGDPSLQGLSPG